MLKSNARLAAVPTTRQQRQQQRGWRRDWPLNTILLVLAVLTYVPLVLVVINSVKDNRQFFTNFWLPTFPFHFDNFIKAWPQISQSIMNSIVYSVPTVFLVLAVSGLAGYAFARYRFFGREVLFFSMLLLIMLPGILLVIPMFRMVVDLKWVTQERDMTGWIKTGGAIILPWTAVQIPFGMFLMRTFFETLPRAYFEAARLDGASELQLFYRIALPLALPAFSTLGILTLLFTWNDIIWPLIAILDSSKHPISIGVLAFSNAYNTDFGATFAGYVLASLPLIIVFAFSARRFMAGLQGGLSI
jgi:ABC-type glycerol-3-phosphate transport system permease component